MLNGVGFGRHSTTIRTPRPLAVGLRQQSGRGQGVFRTRRTCPTLPSLMHGVAMLRFVLATMLSLAMTAMASSAEREMFNGNQMWEMCQSRALGFCNGYVRGTLDALITQGLVTCTPDELGAEQLRDLVVRWLRDNPQKRHLSGTWIVANTLRENFPCPRYLVH